jgi:hypothetical protein
VRSSKFPLLPQRLWIRVGTPLTPPSGSGDRLLSGKATTLGMNADSNSSPGITFRYARPFAQASVYFTSKAGRDFCQYSNSGVVILASPVFLVYGLAVA